MDLLLKKYAIGSGKLLDVGSYDVNGSYRELSPSTYTYTGLDISAGDNVDIVAPDLYKWPIPDNSYDLVISGQCMEHVEAPWLWIQEIYRVSKSIAIIIAPWSCGEHRFPVDCWRILPDGMRYLLGKVGGFNVLECGRNDKGIYDLGDTWGVGRK
jgi:SAM-dependent methyltransferase